ncbi:uncharacterized protein MYCGRDRAFT_43828 [Zymoseptoria tritici IPO323]|uniref:BRCT domain-containing protein n=1 Tax=Zymoseptoria tritici (strain CBS 115943 / IPO323) TaxID=336722 RepID=F9XDF0_ZYMTI|nr:uncharacterized protein MYCGRDRAFT_43828 [Zymoseptoria tritici IPO323]EGP86815.1 hypothetical protein MYCGRDRAFT_43828 [Zymoseptoria tritici IPO323]
MPTKAPVAAKPSKSIFDPFNSSSTGHQRAENKLSGSTSWRDSRHLKLREQFTAGTGGGKRVSDTVGAGSLDFGRDGRTENGGWEAGAKGLRTGGQQSLETSWPSPSEYLSPIDPIDPTPKATHTESTPSQTQPDEKQDLPPAPQIFTNLCFYINGSTAPYSDHALKHLISKHGGNMSIALGRRTVTHVIVGKPTREGGGCGGGLASSKVQKEIGSMRGKGIKFISAEWIMESAKAGKRLPESRFEGMRLAPSGVKSISALFGKKS